MAEMGINPKGKGGGADDLYAQLGLNGGGGGLDDEEDLGDDALLAELDGMANVSPRTQAKELKEIVDDYTA